MNPDLLFDPAAARQGRCSSSAALCGQCRQITKVFLLLACLLLTGCYTNTSDVTATPNPVDFGSLQLNQSKNLSVSVLFGTNITGTSIAISGTNAGDFQIVSQTCVGGMGAQSAVIRFKPAAVGSRAATLTILGRSPRQGSIIPNTYTRTVTLTGYAIAPLAASLAGAALQFDGTSSRITIPHNNALDTFPFTVEAWVSAVQGSDATLVSKGASGMSNGWQMTLHNGKVSAAYFRDGSDYVADNGAYTFTSGIVADGQWHHVAFVVDIAGGRLYLDGVLQNTLAWTGTPGVCSTTQSVTLGAAADGSSAYLGQMDEVRLWNAARTSAQIQVNARATQKENEPGLLACYRLDEGKGTTIADATANHFNGALSGSGVWVDSRAPIDAVIVAPGQPRAFKMAGFDVNGNALTFTPASYPAQGTLNISSPTLTYAPGFNFTSVDTFTYTAGNGASISSPTTVRLLYRAPGANTLYVPTQYATIQAAVDAAGTGDTILVANGTYTGVGSFVANFRGKGLTLKSAGGAAACIIDCQQQRGAFLLSGGETGASRIDGFTIQNGNGDFGLRVSYGTTIVANCLIRNNTSGGMYGGTAMNCTFTGNASVGDIGGGMYYGTAINCLFTNNAAGQGGGMYGGTATNCTFTRNSAQYGGGIVYGAAQQCTFINNRADFSGGGAYASPATNCVFMNNSASYGGGMCGYDIATNCVFIGNTASSYGGGLEGESAFNCTIVGNSAPTGGGVAYFNTLANCIIWGNTAPNGPQVATYGSFKIFNCDVQGGFAGAGNINADPLFVNVAGGDYHLAHNSPCIDAGTTAGVPLPATDLDGNPRVLGIAPDMGAYEFISRR